MNITGTFLDEISHDIPSSNWGKEEWALDFDAMKSFGIDTVIMIRAGYKDNATFQSNALNKHLSMRPVYIDLVDIFLSEAERCNMDFYFGLYDSGKYWHEGNYEKELSINIELAEEVINKYGERSSFCGWYASHEIYRNESSQVKLIANICEELKQFNNLPILLSPYMQGRKQFENPITPNSMSWNGMRYLVIYQDMLIM